MRCKPRKDSQYETFTQLFDGEEVIITIPDDKPFFDYVGFHKEKNTLKVLDGITMNLTASDGLEIKNFKLEVFFEQRFDVIAEQIKFGIFKYILKEVPKFLSALKASKKAGEITADAYRQQMKITEQYLEDLKSHLAKTMALLEKDYQLELSGLGLIRRSDPTSRRDRSRRCDDEPGCSFWYKE